MGVTLDFLSLSFCVQSFSKPCWLHLQNTPGIPPPHTSCAAATPEQHRRLAAGFLQGLPCPRPCPPRPRVRSQRDAMKTCAINTCTHCYLPGTILNINSLNPFNNLTDEKMKAWKILKITCPRSHHHEWQSQDSNRGSLALERHALQYHAMPLYSQLQLWLLITITWEFLKIPRPRLDPPDQLNQKLWRWALGIGAFLKLPGNSSVQPRLRTTALMQSTRSKNQSPYIQASPTLPLAPLTHLATGLSLHQTSSPLRALQLKRPLLGEAFP